MTPAAPLRTLLVKEARALLPIWMATALAGIVQPFTSGVIHSVSGPAFGAGMIALGAYSIGHEYVHRTVGVMLTVPTERRRIFLVKLGVLGVMILPLAAYASIMGLFQSPAVRPWLVAAGALSLVPLLTMLCRNPLAGGMFGIWISTMVLIAVLATVVGRLDAPPEVERAAFVTWRRVMLVLFAGGAVFGWRLFRRLEWIESGVEIAMPSWAAASRTIAPSHPMWQLTRKELRLQRLACGLAALYVVAAVADATLRFVRPHDLPLLAMATIGYWLCLPVLMGSVASAEERQLGTLSSQLLLPVPAWQQWAAKAGTVFGLALLLGIALPVLALSVLGPSDQIGHAWPDVGAVALQTFVLAAVGLYVSSLVGSGLMAVAISFAAIAGFLSLTQIVAPAVAQSLFRSPFGMAQRADGVLAAVAVAAVPLVRFAYVNHRHEPRHATGR